MVMIIIGYMRMLRFGLISRNLNSPRVAHDSDRGIHPGFESATINFRFIYMHSRTSSDSEEQ